MAGQPYDIKNGEIPIASLNILVEVMTYQKVSIELYFNPGLTREEVNDLINQKRIEVLDLLYELHGALPKEITPGTGEEEFMFNKKRIDEGGSEEKSRIGN